LLQKLLLLTIIFLIAPVYLYLKDIPVQQIPYPYLLEKSKETLIDAPIVITGDRMGEKFYEFKKTLSDTISVNLSKPIKIASMAKSIEGLHRTINRLKSLKKFPKVVIYTGASQEEWEYLFITREIPTILKNFKNYEDPKLQTLLLLFPFLSKIFYQKIHSVKLPQDIVLDPNQYTDIELFKRIELHYRIYKHELQELVDLVREKNSFLILMTTPLNPNTKPKKICTKSESSEISEKLKELIKLIKKKDFRSAYAHAKILHYLALGNTRVQYLYSRICRKLGKKNEALYALELSSSYDCKRWRANGVYNSILRSVAKSNDIFLYDFDHYLKDNWDKNITFFDEIYPQNVFYERANKAIGRLIKKILKL
jgi:hypothetical protein